MINVLGDIDKVYGPWTIECGPFGRFTKYLLWFRPMHVYETPEAVSVYKIIGRTMYVILVIRKGPPSKPVWGQTDGKVEN